jgi:tetratricopeptide (TPR) repeat protein
VDANLRLTKAAYEQGPAMAVLAASLKTTKQTSAVALGAVLLASLDDIASVKALLPLVDAEPDPGQSVVVPATIAHAYVKAADGDTAGAVKDVEALLVEFPQAIDTNFHLARLREKAGNLDGAIAAYRTVVQAQPVLGANPALAPARLYLARVLAQKGDTAGAKEQLDALNAQWKDADTDFPWRQQARK